MSKLDIHQSDSWIEHAEMRRQEASEIKLLLERTRLLPETIVGFLPRGTKVADLDPAKSLRDLSDDSISPARNVWIPRPDLFAEIAQWLRSRAGRSWLLLEAGYSKLGDAVLATRKHMVHDARPFLAIRLDAETVETVATYLRWGRGGRLLGVCTIAEAGDQNHALRLPLSRGLFLCDNLDGDSILAVEFESLN